MSDFWLASGHHLCDRAEGGRIIATPAKSPHKG